MVSVFKDNHLKTQIGKDMELRVPIWHSGMHEAFLINVGSTHEATKKKGYFNAYDKASEAHQEYCSAMKQAKAQLAKLDGSTGRELELPRSPKKPTIWLRPAKLTQPCTCMLTSLLKSSKLRAPQIKPRPGENRLPWTCSSSMTTFCQSMQITHGTRLSKNRPQVTPIQTSKAVLRNSVQVV
jgi:hypothetical protein